MCKVLVVDDDDAIRDLLQIQLKRNGYEVMEAEDGEKALDKAADSDFILLDIMLPKLDGYEVCRRLKANEATKRIPIIMLTAKTEEIDTVLGLELGADDYLAKPFSMRELLARMKAVERRTAKREEQEKEMQLQLGSLCMDFSAHRVRLAGQEIELTPKEYELLKQFLTHVGRAYSRDELLSRIWGYDYYGDTRTVDVHIRHLRQKLAADPSIADAIETVRGVGYRFMYPKESNR
ncbi:MAG: response regulator transcription factor [Selenomonadaceae bacterium]|nr:response regulator transcription factor [Selenomonadaceae bacterium]MDY2684975.1 response regulator transcription factor [Selenomonadaceae bacterium]